jgi:shikimate kinase
VAQIILTGFMATGKSEVGRRLARELGRVFVDTDGMVEARVGRTVADVFGKDGEAAFRALEREAVEAACAVPDAVVAVGGGAMLDADSRRRLAASGVLVCLTATPEEILRRVGTCADRPLLASVPPAERLGRIQRLLTDRAAAYAAANHRVDTTGRSIDEVVADVATLVAGR